MTDDLVMKFQAAADRVKALTKEVSRIRRLQQATAADWDAVCQQKKHIAAERDAAEHLAHMLKGFIEEARDERDVAEAELDAIKAENTRLQKELEHIVSEIGDYIQDPGDKAIAMTADYTMLREAIHKMVSLYEIGERSSFAASQESADRALAFLSDMEAKNCPPPRLIVDDANIVLTWVIGGWKLYHYCDAEETQAFDWKGRHGQ